jgi:rod shape-determining protein MreB
MRNQLGIDLGSANLVASAVGEGVVMQEPSVIALVKDSGRVLAVGLSAEQKLKVRDPAVAGTRPFGAGLTANPDITQEVLAAALENAGYHKLLGGELLFSVPCDFTAAQEDILLAMAENVGARACFFLYSPLAAMMGGYTSLPASFLAVDIGATKTNIMLVCRGRIYHMKALAVGGEAFDKAILDYVWQKRKVHISRRTAEDIKMKVGTVGTIDTIRSVDVTGRDAHDRSATIRITNKDMYEALEGPIGEILEAICIAVSKVPDQSVREVFELGICLSGGGACLTGIDKMIGGVVGVPTHVLGEPMTAIARGLSDTFGVLPPDIPQNLHNISEFVMKRSFATK